MSEYLSGWMSTITAAKDQLAEASQNLANSAQEAVSELSSQASRIASDLENVTLQDITEKITSIPGAIQDQANLETKDGESRVRILPWATTNEEKSILCQSLMEQILALSSDKETFVSSPNKDEDFKFDLEAHIQIIMQLMEIDPNLGKMQSTLGVKVPEEIFWKNYFHRIAHLRVQAGIEPLYSPPPPLLPEKQETEDAVPLEVPANQGMTVNEVKVEPQNQEKESQSVKEVVSDAEIIIADNTEGGSEPNLTRKESSGSADILDEDFEDFALGSDSEDGFIDPDLEAEIALELEDGDII